MPVEARYEERLARPWKLAGPIGLIAAVILLVAGGLTGRGALGGAGMALAIVALVWTTTAWSIDRYSAITIDDDHLRVGRARLPLATVTAVIPESELPSDVVLRARRPFPSSQPGGRLFGGAWGLGARLEPVGITSSDLDRLEVVGTTDPDRLMAQLERRRGR